MHVLFIHPNFPAQFGHIAAHLTTELGWQATCATSIDTTHLQLPFVHLNYKLKPGPQPKTFYNPGSLNALIEHMAAVYQGFKSLPDFKPDLVVGHMSYGTMLYLRNLFDCPFVGYYELLPPPFWSEEFALRKEFPPNESVRLSNATYHSLTLLHLHMVDAAYTPTYYQLSTAPKELQHKIRVIFDGVDTERFRRREIPRPTEFRGVPIPEGVRVVTYASRGLESIRGFDVFMKVADQICRRRSDVVFLVAGEERTNYGHELSSTGGQSFKQYVVSQGDYDLSRIHFLGRIPAADLATMFSLSDVHFYLTVPYVLSWSLIQAMSTGCRIVGSATAPVQEAIDHRIHGLLAAFGDVDRLTEHCLELLDDHDLAERLGNAARRRVELRYEKSLCIGRLVKLFEEVSRSRGVSRQSTT